MDAERYGDRVVRSWLREDRHEDVTDVLNNALDALDATPQRRSMWLARRTQPMPNTVRIALAAAAVVVTAFLGYQLLIAPNVGGEIPTPTAAPSSIPSITPAPSDMGPAEVGLLEAGRYSTTVFQPRTTFTVGDGWTYVSEDDDQFVIQPATDVAAQMHVNRWRTLPVPVDNTNTPIPGEWTDILDVMTYVAERPDLVVVQQPTLWGTGGLTGYWMEIDNPGDIELVIFQDGQNVYPGGHNRFALLQMADGSVVDIVMFTFEGSESYVEAMTPIVESFVFDLP
jgi:hypothetical protein